MDGMDGFWKLWNVWMGLSIMWQFDYVIVYGLSYGAWWYKGKEGFLVFQETCDKLFLFIYEEKLQERDCNFECATVAFDAGGFI